VKMNKLKRNPKTIGASDIAVLCGESQFKNVTVFNVWDRIVNSKPFDSNGDDTMEWGHYMEPAGLNWFEKQYAVKLIRGKTFYHPDKPLYGCTPDGWKYPYVVNVKNVSHNVHLWDDNNCPNDYRLQSLWETYIMSTVTDAPIEKSYLFPIIFGRFPKERIVQFNQDMISNVLDIVQDFADNYIEPKKLPPNDASEAYGKHLANFFTVPKEKIYLDADKEFEQLALQYQQQVTFVEQCQENMQYIKNEIIAKIGDAYGIKIRILDSLSLQAIRSS